MGLFTDIYNTVAKFFRPQEEQGDASKSVATNRLKLVLMQDRTNLTPKILEQMRGELIDLLSRYVELDKELLELNFEHEGDQVALMLSIPVIRAKEEEEIEAALKAEAEKLEEKAEEISAKSEDEEEIEATLKAEAEKLEAKAEEIKEASEENSEDEAEETEDSEEEVSENETNVVSTPEDMSSNSTSEEDSKEECNK